MTACMLVCFDSLTITVECTSTHVPQNSVWSTDNGAVAGLSIVLSCTFEPTLVTSVMNGQRPLLTLTEKIENADLLSFGAVLIIAPKAHLNFYLNLTLTAETSPDFSSDLR
jgi:hypothetical protein